MLLFKKKEPERMAGKGFVPMERIKELSSKGFSEPEIIDVLRKDGYSPEEIDKGLTQVLRAGVSGEHQPLPASSFMPKPEERSQLPTLQQLEAPKLEMPQIPETSLPQEYYEAQYSPEEYIDYAVKEKVGEIDKKITEFIIKQKELEKRMEEVHEQLNLLSQTRTGEQQQILNRIDDFRETINDADIRLGSLEKAFKDTLPALIESVRALCDLVQQLKSEA